MAMKARAAALEARVVGVASDMGQLRSAPVTASPREVADVRDDEVRDQVAGAAGRLPVRQTVYGLFRRWRDDGAWAWTASLLLAPARVAAGRGPEPSAGVTGAQSVHESAEGVVPVATSGFDHFKIRAASATSSSTPWGLLIAVAVTPASAAGRGRLALVWADKAYHGDWRHWARRELGVTVQVVEQPPRPERLPRPAPPLGRRAHPRPGRRRAHRNGILEAAEGGRDQGAWAGIGRVTWV